MPAALLGFLVMSFAGGIGVATSRLSVAYGFAPAVIGILPLLVFLWFFVLSLPVGGLCALRTQAGRGPLPAGGSSFALRLGRGTAGTWSICGWKSSAALRSAFQSRYGKSMRDWRAGL